MSYKVDGLHAHLLLPEEIDRPFELRRQQKRLEEGERREALPFVRALPKFTLQICDALLKPTCDPRKRKRRNNNATIYRPKMLAVLV